MQLASSWTERTENHQRRETLRKYTESRIRYVVNNVLEKNGYLFPNVIRVGRRQTVWLSSSGVEMFARVRRTFIGGRSCGGFC